MSAEWYYQELGKERGPVTATALCRLAMEDKIGPETWVRKGTDANWVPATKVKGLFNSDTDATRPLPPPLPNQEITVTRTRVPLSAADPRFESPPRDWADHGPSQSVVVVTGLGAV